MDFNLEIWRSQAAQKLQQINHWLSLHSKAKLPYFVYGTVSGLSLWPLVETAVSTGQLAPVFATLYSTAAGVGAKLITSQLEAWKNQAAPPTETDVSTWISQQAVVNTELRYTLDAILAALNALPTAQNALPEKSHDRFRQLLRSELTQLGNVAYYEAFLAGSGAVAQGDGAIAVGERGVHVGGDVGGDIIPGQKVVVTVESGATLVMNNADQPADTPALNRDSAVDRYLTHVIAHNRYLQLQGVRSGGRLVHIELEQIYITLRATQQRTVSAEERWLAQEAQLAPGERHRTRSAERETVTEVVTVSVNEALSGHRRLVVLGDPGSGKTTLLRYLALIYARDKSEPDGSDNPAGPIHRLLGLPERGCLPILLPLRQIGAYLQDHSEESTEGPRLLLEFLRRYLANERIDVPLNFFDPYLAQGQAVVLLDGLDEVPGADLRRRVARLVERFTQAYPACRYVVTSRIVGYEGAARLGEGYTTTTVQEFSLADVEQFLRYWHRLVWIGQMGPGPSAEHEAERQTAQLLAAIRGNERIRELAINPLMLTVIALVHRDRVKLPDRRAELYAEAVDVLLGKWDEAKSVLLEQPILPDRPFDATDRRLLLQSVALHMHEQGLKEIEADALQTLLRQLFRPLVADDSQADKATRRFLRVIEERTGLLVARGDGVYSFSHLTFQEYLTALAVAARDDYVAYTLAHSGEAWWREVILLEAGCLSLTSKERTNRLIAGIASHKVEPVPYHNLVLSTECLRDVGEGRTDAAIAEMITNRLREALETQPSWLARRMKGKLAHQSWIERRSAVVTALVRAGAGYWTPPYGEPEWVEIPAGEFTMGSERGRDNEKPVHRVNLLAYAIARVPITNAQYQLFVAATGQAAPLLWRDGRIPKGLESHPVVYVSWQDAVAYCAWLSQVTGKSITLPSEAEWEKAARGDKDAREYPWGDTFDRLRCNTDALGLGTTTPVGIFPEGASPYGVLDMSGNVWEWTRSLYKSYPYQAGDGRENMAAKDSRVLRGGSWRNGQVNARAAARGYLGPDNRDDYSGFRVVVVRFSPSHQGH